jgi:hypothetical protein
MRKMDTRKELVGLVNKLSDEDLEEARRLLQELLMERNIPIDDEPLDNEEMAAVERGKKHTGNDRLAQLSRYFKFPHYSLLTASLRQS